MPTSMPPEKTVSTRRAAAGAAQKSGDEVRSWHLVERGEAGASSAVVVPSWGANVIASSVQHPDLAWPLPLLESVDLATVALKPTSYGVPLLAPTPGGVGPDQSGVFSYKGRTYRVPRRHGFLRNRSWEVAESSPSAITCLLNVESASHASDEYFRFAYQARYEVHAIESGFRCALRIENTGSETQPIDLGWHPYFHRSGICTVQIPGAARWEMTGDGDPMPTGKILPIGGNDDFRKGRVVQTSEHWDDTFTDLPEQEALTCWMEESVPVLTKAGSRAVARVRRAVTFRTQAGGEVRPMRHVQLYTPPSRPAICIEPLSAPPDAINLLSRQHPRADVTELAPGAHARFEATFTATINLA
jgi:galactose mutarotase-like enzyme